MRLKCAASLGDDIALDRLDGVVGMRAREREKHVRHAAERAAGALQRLDGVGEIGLRLIAGDGRDLGLMRGQRRLEGRQEMPGLDPLERRRRERARRPVLQQRIGGGLGG